MLKSRTNAVRASATCACTPTRALVTALPVFFCGVSFGLISTVGADTTFGSGKETICVPNGPPIITIGPRLLDGSGVGVGVAAADGDAGCVGVLKTLSS